MTTTWWIERLAELPYAVIQSGLITLWLYAIYVALFDRGPK